MGLWTALANSQGRSAPAAAARGGASTNYDGNVARQTEQVSLQRQYNQSLVDRERNATLSLPYSNHDDQQSSTCLRIVGNMHRSLWATANSSTLDIAGQVLLIKANRPPLPPEAVVPCERTHFAFTRCNAHGAVMLNCSRRLHTNGERCEETHEEQVVACLHAVLLGEGREVIGCASLEFLRKQEKTSEWANRSKGDVSMSLHTEQEMQH